MRADPYRLTKGVNLTTFVGAGTSLPRPLTTWNALAFDEKARPAGYRSPVLSTSKVRARRIKAGLSWAKPGDTHEKIG